MNQLIFLLSLFCVGESVHNLTFMFVTSFGQSGFNASGVVPAADIALEDINSHPDVLQGYHLTYDKVRDSQCHRGRSLDAYFQGIFMESPTKLAVVGCGCSVATEPVAEISHQWNISQISYASSSAVLSDRSKYKSFFRNTFNMQIIAPALRSAVSHFNWTRIALLTQDEGLFTGTESDVREEFKEAGIEVESRMFSTDGNPTTVIEDLFQDDLDYRVFFINSFADKAREIICYAQERNYTYPRYAWILYDWYADEWWTAGDPVNCSDGDLRRFLDRTITVQLPEFGNGTTSVGTTLMVFTEKYEERARNEGYAIINQAYKLYDALWVLALALNSTDAMRNNAMRNNVTITECENATGSLVPLEEFDYSNELMGCLIRWNIQQTHRFYGLTGQILFDEAGTRIHTQVFFRQYQVQGNQLMKFSFAEVDKLENFIFYFTSNTSIYPVGTPPDGSSVPRILTFKTWLIALFDTLAILGIIFAVACFLFNLIFRNRRTVRLSSPTLNYFIILGAVLMYVSIFFYLLPTEDQIVVKVRCVVEYWLFTVGYSLAFGAVFVKMWRVFQIFHNPQPNRKILTDWKLIIMVLAITGFTTLLLIIGEAIPFLRGTAKQVNDPESREGRNSLGVRVKYCVWLCQEVSAPSFYWQIFVFFYLIMLQVVGLVLAIQTRKVKLRGLRDSKYIAAIIYISSISIVVMALVTFALERYINIGTGIFVFCVFTLTTIFLVLIFVPKMILLYHDPYGKKPSVAAHHTRSDSKPSNGIENAKTAELEKKVVSLEKIVLEGERTVAELRQRIETLTKEKNIVQNGNHLEVAKLPVPTSISSDV